MSHIFFIKFQNNVRSHFWILSILRQEKWGFFIKKKLKKDQFSECNTTQNKKKSVLIRMLEMFEVIHEKWTTVVPYKNNVYLSIPWKRIYVANTYIYMNRVQNGMRLRHIFEPMNRYESLWSISHNVLSCNFQVADIKCLHSFLSMLCLITSKYQCKSCQSSSVSM